MLVKLNINNEVYKDIYSFNFANSKVSINNTMFNWKHGGSTIVNIQLDNPSDSDILGLRILKNHCQFLSRIMNNYVNLERPCTLEVKIMNPDSLQDVDLELSLYLNNKHLIKFNWNITSKLYNNSDVDISEQIKNLIKFSIDEFNSYDQSINIELFANKIGIDSNMILLTQLIDTNIPQSLTNIEDVKKVLFLLLGYNALDKLTEFEIAYLIRVLNIL